MNISKRFLLLLLSVAISLSVTGCDNTAPTSGEDNSAIQHINTPRGEPTGYREYFKLYSSDATGEPALVLDEYGNIIPKDKQFSILYDIVTGKPQCQSLETLERVGKDEEYNLPIVKRWTALYDEYGKQITQPMNILHKSAFDDFIILADDEWKGGTQGSTAPRGLWNYKTGELVLKDVGRLDVFDADKKLFVASKGYTQEFQGEIIGIIDETGNIVSTPKDNKRYHLTDIQNGMIIASEIQNDEQKNNYSVVFSKDFEPLLEAENIWGSFWSSGGNYISYTKNEVTYVVDYNLKPLYQYNKDENNNYIDDECVIKYFKNEQTEEFSYSLCDTNSNVLVDDMISISPILEESEEAVRVELFVSIDKSGIYIHNRKGEIVAQKLHSNINSCTYLGDGLILYQVNNQKSGLLDLELKSLLEPEKYQTIYRGYIYEDGDSKTNDNLLVCSYSVNGREQDSRIDLLDKNLNPIITNINSYFSSTKDLIAVRKGFSIGLIDYNGNWVDKHSIFTNLELEDLGWITY